MKKIPVAILGCRGMVGQQFIRLLENHPFFSVDGIVASEESAGKRYGNSVQWILSRECPGYARNMTMEKPDVSGLVERGVGVAFSALPSDVASHYEAALREKGIAVFSNASAFRMQGDVPILVPEVNADHIGMAKAQILEHGGFIITNSNCTTAGLVMALKPVLNIGIRGITVSTYQALSGAGLDGIPAMRATANLIPYIEEEEEKMERESRKILGEYRNGLIEKLDVPFFISCCRVPVVTGHLLSVGIEFESDVCVQDLVRRWRTYRGQPQKDNLPTSPAFPIIISHEPDRPQPLLDCDAGYPRRARGMAITVGRIRKANKNIRFFLLVHNTIRGAAGSSVLNAEMAYTRGLLHWE